MSAIDFVAGCFGGECNNLLYNIVYNILSNLVSSGAAGVLVGHPLDTVKVKLQMQVRDNNALEEDCDGNKEIVIYSRLFTTH